MALTRRVFSVGCALLAAGFLTQQALAQPWPSRPIRLLVAYGAGSPPDLFARVYAANLAKQLGATVVVENKPGASGNLASAEAARATPDGYTFLYSVSSAFTINPFVYTNMPFNADKDLSPVGTTIIQGYVLVANNKLPATNLPELISQAKKNDGKLSYASWGVGSYSHLLMERILDDTKTHMLHVPYRNAPLNEVIGGQVDVLVEPMASAIQFITSGKVKPLAYTGETRHPALASVPTMTETLPGMTLYSWHGIWAPASTPKEIVAKLNAAIDKASKDPQVIQKIKSLECDPLTVSPDEMKRMISKESAIYSRLVKAKNIKLD